MDKKCGCSAHDAQEITTKGGAVGEKGSMQADEEGSPRGPGAACEMEPEHAYGSSALAGQRLQELALWGCRCMKPIGLGNCSISVAWASSCRLHTMRIRFSP